jgi:hypothetical protein
LPARVSAAPTLRERATKIYQRHFFMNSHLPYFPACDEPVFMVGAPRTASSFLCSALIEFGGFAGSSEGHILPLLNALDGHVLGYYALMRKQGLLDIPENSIAKIPLHAMRHAILDVFRNYSAVMFGSSRWIDKTVNVEMIEALPFLMEAWPRARVVFLARSGISNVLSATAYFKVGFEECCVNWVRCCEAWDRTRPQLIPDHVMEISHEDLLQSPERTAQSLAAWLSLSSASSGELIGGIERAVRDWSRGRSVPVSVEDTAWSAADRRTFLRICGEQMVAQGYMTEAGLTSQRKAYEDLDERPLPGASARVLIVDQPDFFRVERESVYVVPGRKSAALVEYENIAASGFRSLRGTLEVTHQNSQGVRFEFIGVCQRSGDIVLKGTFEIAALERRDFTLPFDRECEVMDLLLRVVCGAAASTNDYSWGCLSNLRLAL